MGRVEPKTAKKIYYVQTIPMTKRDMCQMLT